MCGYPQVSGLLDCGHAPDKGSPANVAGKTIMGWRFVVDDDGRKICHACADRRVLDCGHTPSPHGNITTGYGTTRDGRRECYDCCAARERAAMIATGRATLYLTGDAVTDWPGKLRFPVGHVRKGRHNMARVRYDFRFSGPDGATWSGVQYGDNTQIAHCRRVK